MVGVRDVQRAFGARRPHDVYRAVESGLIAVQGDLNPGTGRPRGYTRDSLRDARVAGQLRLLMGAQGGSKPRTALMREVMRKWRGHGRPRDVVVGLRDKVPTIWLDEDELLRDLRSGCGLVLVRVPPRSEERNGDEQSRGRGDAHP